MVTLALDGRVGWVEGVGGAVEASLLKEILGER